jgi:hypothetical protein
VSHNPGIPTEPSTFRLITSTTAALNLSWLAGLVRRSISEKRCGIKYFIYFFDFVIFPTLNGGIESRRCCTTDSVQRFCFLLDEVLMRGDEGS